MKMIARQTDLSPVLAVKKRDVVGVSYCSMTSACMQFHCTGKSCNLVNIYGTKKSWEISNSNINRLVPVKVLKQIIIIVTICCSFFFHGSINHGFEVTGVELWPERSKLTPPASGSYESVKSCSSCLMFIIAK
ncbi:hypothetical protein AMECASPLE_002268 [Ameca splendens]|uniref:Uncharacterized protein n=1 Tax=Ameca splendens TaxID=208324 RepID=A0ABV0XMB2_9TELE